MWERKIGEEFDYNGITLKVVEDDNCSNCYFGFLPDCYNKREVTGGCSRTERRDKTSVIFKKLKV